jgi:CBS domain-containing protein
LCVLAERGVPVAPVVDSEGRLLGIANEGGLIHNLGVTASRRRGPQLMAAASATSWPPAS